MNYTAPRGTRDILPTESAVWQWIENQTIELCQKYGFHEIRTPIFEQTDLFQRAVGEATDIVSKEMYTFSDRGERSLTLRPEGTASIVRAYLQHQLAATEKISRLLYRGPMFRYERPQAGRYRQFYQLGFEILGAASALVDAEIISMGIDLLAKLGITDLTVSINSVGCDVCRPVIREQLRGFLQESLPQLCDDCRYRFEKNPLRILDCKNKTCQNYFSGLPSSTKILCQSCGEHFSSLITYLDLLKVNYAVDDFLVRGLDYYTKTVFEIRSNQLGAQNAICGGGRYDNLVHELGGQPTPAFGFAIGMDRLYMVLEQLNHIPTIKTDIIDFYFMTMGEKERQWACKIMHDLRNNGLSCDINYDIASIKTLFRDAERKKALFAIIIGEDELDKQAISVKNMKTREQYNIHAENMIIELIKLRKEINQVPI